MEIYKGTGKVIDVQEKMSIIESDRSETRNLKKSSSSFWAMGNEVYSETYLLDFEDPEIGDLVKPI